MIGGGRRTSLNSLFTLPSYGWPGNRPTAARASIASKVTLSYFWPLLHSWQELWRKLAFLVPEPQHKNTRKFAPPYLLVRHFGIFEEERTSPFVLTNATCSSSPAFSYYYLVSLRYSYSLVRGCPGGRPCVPYQLLPRP